jgi:hypothetical protein
VRELGPGLDGGACFVALSVSLYLSLLDPGSLHKPRFLFKISC